MLLGKGKALTRSRKAAPNSKGSAMKKTNFRSRHTGYHPLRKIWTALSGLKYAVALDLSVQYKVWVSLAFLIITARFETVFHFLFLLAVTGAMLMAEILNSTVEELCNYLQTDYDERIKRIKDMAAAAAFIALLIWYVVLGIVLYELVFTKELFFTAPRH